MSLECPSCKQISPDNATICDCGVILQGFGVGVNARLRQPSTEGPHSSPSLANMQTKVCVHCRMTIPQEASVCAFCRGPVSAGQAAAQLIGGLLTVAGVLWGLYNWWQATQATK